MNRIACQICGQDVDQIRSVLIREWPEPGAAGEPERPLSSGRPAGRRRGTPFRRAFLCESCYQALDAAGGVAELATPHRAPRRFSLAKNCRQGRAAVYDYSRWHEYRQRKVAELGIELAPPCERRPQ